MSSMKNSLRRSSRSPTRGAQKSSLPVHALSDEELRAELIALGVNVGPITQTTRSIYEKQLEKRRQSSKPSGSPSRSSGLLKRSSGDLTISHEEPKHPPTPPRPTMTPRYQTYTTPAPSSSRASRSFEEHSEVLKGTYSPISNFLRPRRQLDFVDNRERKQRDVVEDDSGESDEDDHMESSRIVTSPHGRTSSTQKPFWMQSMLNKFLKMWASFTAPSKPLSKVPRPYRSSPEGGSYSYSYFYPETTPERNAIFGFDISRVLLFLVLSLFGFLLIAYLTTANPDALVQGGRIIYASAKDTASFFYTYAILPLLGIALVSGTVAGMYMLQQYQAKKKAKERERTFELIEKITDIIRDAKEQGQIYVAEPHVRDMILPPSQRMRDSPEWRRWQEAVKFINMNESRVSTETRIVGGAECSVWRWIPAKKNGWQGNAFDGNAQLNVPEQALSHCLKLRGMFSSSKDPKRRISDVVEALQEKLAPTEPIHVHVEKDSKEGLVFVRFETLHDCSRAFKSLHGSWFNGQLVWAKFLRDERYEQRFPSAPRG